MKDGEVRAVPVLREDLGDKVYASLCAHLIFILLEQALSQSRTK